VQHDIDVEFDRQRDVLLAKDYPGLVGLSAKELTVLVEPLRAAAHSATTQLDRPAAASRVPFVLVVSSALARAEDLVPLTSLAGGTAPGVLDRNHGEGGLTPYRPIADLDVPTAPVYLLVDVERGEEFCGVRPEDALPVILGRGRTPLTIHEGIALITHFPGVLEKNRCFMLAGSRRGDRRVPALWISGKAPKLGWCWDGNPHTWLGTASAGSRAHSMLVEHTS
jgi:hypothetical protein